MKKYNGEQNMADDDTSTELVEVGSTRVLGLGIGIFLIGFFTIALVVVFLISTPCSVRPKVFCRGLWSLILGVVILLLVYAPRENAFETDEDQIKVYDQSVIPRIAVVSVLLVFTVFAANQLLKGHLMESHQLSNRQHDGL